ncbi:MAG: nuclear transport factor 2 family protein [Planctomycetota bacterium]|jgi:hypothetical protein|nr:nuclear transport factor 2 family protein [Planctomycetota bacterium]
MIAHRHDTALDHDGIAATIDSFATALASGSLEQTMYHFDQHAILIPHDHALPQEGSGAVRSYYRRRLGSVRDARIEIETVEAGHNNDQARVRIVLHLGARSLPGLVALQRRNHRWLISHFMVTPAQPQAA